MNFLSVLHVERAYELKKGNFSVFFSQFGVKKEVILILGIPIGVRENICWGGAEHNLPE